MRMLVRALPLVVLFVVGVASPVDAFARHRVAATGDGGTATAQPAVDLDLRFDRVNRVDPVTGVASITGSVACRRIGDVGIQVHVRQTTRTADGTQTTLDGDGYTATSCTDNRGRAGWTALVFSPNGNFEDGRASSFARAAMDNPAAGSTDYDETAFITIRLSAKR